MAFHLNHIKIQIPHQPLQGLCNLDPAHLSLFLSSTIFPSLEHLKLILSSGFCFCSSLCLEWASPRSSLPWPVP